MASYTAGKSYSGRVQRWRRRIDAEQVQPDGLRVYKSGHGLASGSRRACAHFAEGLEEEGNHRGGRKAPRLINTKMKEELYNWR